MGLFDEKTRGKKSRDTVPLRMPFLPPAASDISIFFSLFIM
jgi:hypothetical protein